MNFKLIAAAFAAMGLAACSPSSNVTPQSTATPAESTATAAPAESAASVQLVAADKPADQTAAPAVVEEKKEAAAAPATEAKADEAEKKSN